MQFFNPESFPYRVMSRHDFADIIDWIADNIPPNPLNICGAKCLCECIIYDGRGQNKINYAIFDKPTETMRQMMAIDLRGDVHEPVFCFSDPADALMFELRWI